MVSKVENLNPGIKGDWVSKIGVLGHFLWNQSLKVSNFVHDGGEQMGASFEWGAIFGKNLNLGLIKGLSRD